MQNMKVDDFIQYAKEQFGCDITLNSTGEPDSFEKIYGTSFLEQDTTVEIENGVYENTSVDVWLSNDSLMDFSCSYDMELAA